MEDRFYVRFYRMLDDEVCGKHISQAYYHNFRAQIKNGDCLQWAGPTVLQMVIRWWKKRPGDTIGFSHTSPVFWVNEDGEDRLYVADATAIGLHREPLSALLFKEHGRCFHVSTNMSDAQRAEAKAFLKAETEKGLRYDFKNCFLNIICRASVDASKYFCSEILTACWNRIKYTFWTKAAMPNDVIWWAPPPCVVTEIIMPKVANSLCTLPGNGCARTRSPRTASGCIWLPR